MTIPTYFLLYLNLGNFMDQILFGGRPSVFGATFQSVIFSVFLTPNWGPPNAMVMCEKFSPFGNDYGLVGGALFRRFLGANIAISCLGWRHASWWYVHAAQNEPIMNIFKPHCQAVRLWNHLGACGGLTKPTLEPIRPCQHRIPRSRILESNAAHSCSKYVQLGAPMVNPEEGPPDPPGGLDAADGRHHL